MELSALVCKPLNTVHTQQFSTTSVVSKTEQKNIDRTVYKLMISSRVVSQVCHVDGSVQAHPSYFVLVWSSSTFFGILLALEILFYGPRINDDKNRKTILPLGKRSL